MIRRQTREKLDFIVPIVICTLLWGSVFPVLKIGYAHLGIDGSRIFDLLFFAGCRFFPAGLLSLAYAVIRGCKPLPLNHKSWRGLMLLGLVQISLQYTLFYIGMSHSGAVRGALINGTVALWSVIIARFLFSEKMTPGKILGCALGFGGVVLVNLRSGGSLGGRFSMTGEGFLLLAAMCGACGAMISKKAAAGEDALIVNGWQMTLGGALLLVSGIAGGGRFTAVTPSGIGILSYLSVLSAVSFILFTKLIRKYSASRVCVFIFLNPVFGTFMTGIFLPSENPFTLQNFTALLMVSLGIAAATRASRRGAACAQS